VVSNIANRPWYSHTDTNWRGIEEALIVSNNKKIYVVGGYPNNNISRAFSRVVLNGTTPVYTRMADLNYKDCVGRSHGRLDFLSGDRILMTLGAKYNNGWSGQFEHTATAFIYDEVLNMWSKIPNTPVTELVRDYKSYVRGFYDLEKNFVLPISDNRFLVLKEPKTDVPEPFKSVTELYSPTKRVQIMGEQLSNNTDILFINNTSNQAIINNTLALSGNKGAFIPESNINTEVEAVYQYIISKLDEEPENLTYFTFDPVNDINDVDVTFGVTIDDPEDDPELPDSRRIKFTHNNSTLKAPDGTLYPLETTSLFSLHNNWINLEDRADNEYSFNINKSGTYTVKYETKDNPLDNNNHFDPFNEYRRNSIGGEATIIVHQKPVPEFTVEARENAGMLQLRITDTSYDPDHKTTLANKGIASKSWRRMNSDTNAWTLSVPQGTWFDFGTKDCTGIIELTVTDVLGAESTLTVGIPELKALFDISQTTLRLKADGNLVTNQVVTDRSYSTSLKPITRWEWNIAKVSGTNQGFAVRNDNTSVNHSTLNTWVNNEIISRGKGRYEISLIVKDVDGNASKRPYKRSFNVLPRIPTITFNPEHPVFIEKNPYNWNFSVGNPDGTSLQYSWSLKNYIVKNTSEVNTNNPDNTIELTRNNATPPFTGSFKSNNLKYGVWDINIQLLELLDDDFGETISTTKRIYVIPEILLKGSFTSEAEIIVGENINLIASTTKETDRVFVDLIAPDGTTEVEEGIELTSTLQPNGKLLWEKEYTIPDTVSESGEYNLRFTAQSKYGGEYFLPSGVSREETELVKIDITALKLLDFRITEIVNHPESGVSISNPLQKDTGELPFEHYKTGYYVTFRINSIGQPLEVKATAKVDGVIDPVKGNIPFVFVENDGIEQVWEGRYYSDADLTSGVITLENIIAIKGSVEYNYNLKEPWNGRILIIDGTAYQDGKIARIN
jgi:hypothetical protein